MKKSTLFANAIDRVRTYVKSGMHPFKAVNTAAEELGLYKEGHTYEYLLDRAYEFKHDNERGQK